ncbi:MAG TPA: hypothetical protein VFB68_14390, partial [Xanthobacteraceae bacterium]|nr:hypothetical protein [Xanthobacteraceae bacterium]
MSKARARSAFVPHDLTAPVAGATDGPLASLSAAVKDMYDIAGSRTGGGSPDWLEAQAPARSNAAVVRAIQEAGARDRQDRVRRILLQRERRQRALRHADQSARARPAAGRLVERIG